MSDSGSQPPDDYTRFARLTEKQHACLHLLLERKTSKQIARHLEISKQAVDLRLKTARDTLGASDRDETAIIYARLLQTYDRMPCDPIILPPRPALVPSDFPNGDRADALALNDGAALADTPMEASPSFKDFWRHDHARPIRAWIMAAMLAGLVLLILAGLTIGETLTRLISS